MKADGVPTGFVLCDIPDGGFSDLVGPLYIRHDEHGSSFGFRAEPRHTNVRGAVHGGMLMTFADQVLGITVWEAIDRAPVATISLNCDFVSAADLGDWIEGRAELVRATRSLMFVRGTLAVGGSVVLSASGLWKRLRSG